MGDVTLNPARQGIKDFLNWHPVPGRTHFVPIDDDHDSEREAVYPSAERDAEDAEA
jgi:hypothetical protein